MKQLLLDAVDEAFDRRSWHGTNLRGSIRGLSREVARWRPAPDRHNIWELVVHAAYWKYAARRWLTGEPRGSFSLEGSNWWPRPEEDTDRAWKRDVDLLSRAPGAARGRGRVSAAQVERASGKNSVHVRRARPGRRRARS